MPESNLDLIASWVALTVGLIGTLTSVFVFLLRNRFGEGVLGRGFGIWVLAILFWAVAMIQEGLMELFLVSDLTEIIHQLLMAAGVVLGLVGTLAFYGGFRYLSVWISARK